MHADRHNPRGPAPAAFDPASSLAEAARVLEAFRADPRTIAHVRTFVDVCAACLRSGGKLLAIGNGGSLCDAQHFAEELTGRFRGERAPLAALACTDAGHLTCVGNDYGFDEVFARWVRGVGRRGDVLIILSTSGKSPNCLRAAQAARESGLTTLALLGRGGGPLLGTVDHAIVAPGDTSDRIQELHMLVLHVLVEGIEAAVAPSR